MGVGVEGLGPAGGRRCLLERTWKSVKCECENVAFGERGAWDKGALLCSAVLMRYERS